MATIPFISFSFFFCKNDEYSDVNEVRPEKTPAGIYVMEFDCRFLLIFGLCNYDMDDYRFRSITHSIVKLICVFDYIDNLSISTSVHFEHT